VEDFPTIPRAQQEAPLFGGSELNELINKKTPDKGTREEKRNNQSPNKKTNPKKHKNMQ
jgi:hypothetical protein